MRKPGRSKRFLAVEHTDVRSNSELLNGPVGFWNTEPFGMSGDINSAATRSPRRLKSKAGPAPVRAQPETVRETESDSESDREAERQRETETQRHRDRQTGIDVARGIIRRYVRRRNY